MYFILICAWKGNKVPNYFPIPFSSLQLHEFQRRVEEEETEGQGNGPLTHLSLFSIYFNCFLVVEFSEIGTVEG